MRALSGQNGLVSCKSPAQYRNPADALIWAKLGWEAYVDEEGLRERKWGRFPALRKALEDKRISSSQYGPTSVSDNMFEELNRLVEIAVLARENESAILEIAQSVGRDQMWRDLSQLTDLLQAASSFFEQQADVIRALSSKL